MAQTSGMAPQFSDGVRKTVIGRTPGRVPAPPAPTAKAPGRHVGTAVVPPAPAPAHRRGGHAKHRAGK
jgi:hypothetical protein